MSRRDRQELEDILAAIDAIRAYRTRGDLSDSLVFEAVRVRLIEIGEAVKALPHSSPTSRTCRGLSGALGQWQRRQPSAATGLDPSAVTSTAPGPRRSIP